MELSCNKLCVSSLFFRPFTFISNAFTFTERPQLLTVGFWSFQQWKWNMNTFALPETDSSIFRLENRPTNILLFIHSLTHAHPHRQWHIHWAINISYMYQVYSLLELVCWTAHNVEIVRNIIDLYLNKLDSDFWPQDDLSGISFFPWLC